MEFIKPVWWDKTNRTMQIKFEEGLKDAEWRYQQLLNGGWRPEQAREVLPNSLKTEIVVTTNLREWRHIFNLRCSKKAHPQIRSLLRSCLRGFKKQIPVIFDDIYPELRSAK